MNHRTSAPTRGFAYFMLVGVGLGASGCITEDAPPAGELPSALALTGRAQLVLDDVREIQTGRVCSQTGPHRCFAHARATVDGLVESHVVPAGLGALDLQAAYKLPATLQGTPTIAIVDAYGYPQLEADLAVYRMQYGLPACTIANGCLKIVDEHGGSSLPALPPASDDWTVETALDVDMASAGCPTCKILVVQAQDSGGNGLEVAQNTAATLGATVISNSWGGPEQAGTSLASLEPYFAHPNIAIFVAAGDNGYNDAGQGPDYPGTSAHVIAVGGTKLVKDSSARGWTETAWTSGGSACSLSITKPEYQSASGCAHKATTDIAAVGDPATGPAVYNARNGGWIAVGGTSAAAPLVAAIYAATGNGAHTSGQFLRDNAAKLYDVTSGRNGTCSTAILCTAGIGWDGPTGYGTPNATALLVDAGTGSAATDPSNDGNDGNGGNGGNGGNDGVTEPTVDGTVEGGCSTSHAGSSSASGLVVIGLWFARRRRR